MKRGGKRAMPNATPESAPPSLQSPAAGPLTTGKIARKKKYDGAVVSRGEA